MDDFIERLLKPSEATTEATTPKQKQPDVKSSEKNRKILVSQLIRRRNKIPLV